MHPLRGATPDQNGCNAYGSGAMPTDRVHRTTLGYPKEESAVPHASPTDRNTKPQEPQAPPVWRAPEEPAAVPAGGGGAWPGNTQTPRPIGGRREACGARPDNEATRRAKLAARTASGRAGRAAGGDLSGQQSATRCADGERAGRRPRAHQAARPHATPGTPVGQQATPQRHPQRHEAATGFPATASSRSRSAVHNSATSNQAVMST